MACKAVAAAGGAPARVWAVAAPVVPGHGVYVTGGCLEVRVPMQVGSSGIGFTTNVCECSSGTYATNRAFKYVAAQSTWQELPPAPHGRKRQAMAELNGSMRPVRGADA